MTTTRSIQTLFRYPMKGFSEELLARVQLSPGAGFPMDRALAVTDGNWTYSKASYVPKNKLEFLGLMGHPRLAKIRLVADDEARHLQSIGEDGSRFDIDLISGEGADAFIDHLIRFLGLPSEPRPALCRADGGAFSDLAMLNRAGVHQGNTQFAISAINLASLRDLEARMGCKLDPLRFRANVYYDSDTPWEEQAWLGKYLRIGSALAKVVMSTPRCVITSVNPQTGERDANVIQSLLRHYKHKDLGFYLDVVEGGEVRPGDPVSIEEVANETHSLVSVPLNGVDYAVYVREPRVRSQSASSGDTR